jgi:GntR family transcriptional regulator
MEFRDHQAIYLQIVDYACEQVLLKKWIAEGKIPSIRDLAVELQVNPNTVQRSYDFLQELGVITNRRGVGIFVEKDAVRKVMTYKKTEFTRKELPVIFKNMFLLKMDMKELETLFNSYLKSHSKK